MPCFSSQYFLHISESPFCFINDNSIPVIPSDIKVVLTPTQRILFVAFMEEEIRIQAIKCKNGGTANAVSEDAIMAQVSELTGRSLRVYVEDANLSSVPIKWCPLPPTNEPSSLSTFDSFTSISLSDSSSTVCDVSTASTAVQTPILDAVESAVAVDDDEDLIIDSLLPETWWKEATTPMIPEIPHPMSPITEVCPEAWWCTPNKNGRNLMVRASVVCEPKVEEEKDNEQKNEEVEVATEEGNVAVDEKDEMKGEAEQADEEQVIVSDEKDEETSGGWEEQELAVEEIKDSDNVEPEVVETAVEEDVFLSSTPVHQPIDNAEEITSPSLSSTSDDSCYSHVRVALHGHRIPVATSSDIQLPLVFNDNPSNSPSFPLPRNILNLPNGVTKTVSGPPNSPPCFSRCLVASPVRRRATPPLPQNVSPRNKENTPTKPKPRLVRRKPVDFSLLRELEATPAPVQKIPKLDDFYLYGIIGQGGQGVVYAARVEGSPCVRVLKVMKGADDAEEDKQIREGMRQEVEALKRVAGGLFCMEIEASWCDAKNCYQVSPFYGNQTLAHKLEEKGLFDEGMGRLVMAEMLAGLEFIHSKNIIHRDLKPENIFIDNDGHVAIADFGFAVVLEPLADPRLEAQREVPITDRVGTFEFAAPEMYWAPLYGYTADIYSMGVIFHAVLTGELPYVTKSARSYSQPDLRVLELVDLIAMRNLPYLDHLSLEAKSLITLMLAFFPDNRGSVARCIKHPFFESIDWSDIKAKRITPFEAVPPINEEMIYNSDIEPIKDADMPVSGALMEVQPFFFLSPRFEADLAPVS